MKHHHVSSRRLLAPPQNVRLGPLIHAFNIPAQPEVCVGASAFCEAVCYARRFLFQIQHTRHQEHLERTRRQDFMSSMITEIRNQAVQVLRIHVSGDFYDESYVRSWIWIITKCPQTTFFAYTRSWRDPAILSALAELAGSRTCTSGSARTPRLEPRQRFPGSTVRS